MYMRKFVFDNTISQKMTRRESVERVGTRYSSYGT
jgi:hypothetical protein